MCCKNANWKREEVPDHKFDFIDVHDFHQTTCSMRAQYGWLYILVIKSFAVYIADIYTAISLLASGRWSGSILQSEAAKEEGNSVLAVPFSIGKWIFTACIIVGFLLLAWEARKARAIIKSRDISYAYTNVTSQNWYSLRSYDHFCFFSQISDSKKKKDEFAFFVFFTFKSWKRLILADGPRQVINGITLYSFGQAKGWSTDLDSYFGNGFLQSGILITMLFSLIVWVGSAALLIVAAVMYIPLLCYMQGNLKEYCCHKVDKRIAELMKRKNKRRLAKEAELARKEAAGDYSHLKDKKTGKFVKAPLPQPTLPKLGNFDYKSDVESIRDGRMMHGQGHMQAGYPGSISMASVRNGGLDSYPPQNPYRQHPYAHSDSASISAYAESIHSTDGFASRAAPMGMSDAPMARSKSRLALDDGLPHDDYAASTESLTRHQPSDSTASQRYPHIGLDGRGGNPGKLEYSTSLSGRSITSSKSNQSLLDNASRYQVGQTIPRGTSPGPNHFANGQAIPRGASPGPHQFMNGPISRGPSPGPHQFMQSQLGGGGYGGWEESDGRSIPFNPNFPYVPNAEPLRPASPAYMQNANIPRHGTPDSGIVRYGTPDPGIIRYGTPDQGMRYGTPDPGVNRYGTPDQGQMQASRFPPSQLSQYQNADGNFAGVGRRRL